MTSFVRVSFDIIVGGDAPSPYLIKPAAGEEYTELLGIFCEAEKKLSRN